MVEQNRYRDENIRTDTMNERTDIASGVGSNAPRVNDLENMRSNVGAGLATGEMGGAGGAGRESWRNKNFKDASPDEVREMMKEKVAKGIAAVTGALEGFVERSRRGELAGKTRQAIEQAGETSREAISATSDQLSKTGSKVEESRLADNAKQAFQKVGETTRRVSGAVKEETQRTREELGKGKKSSAGGGTMGTSAYNRPRDLGGVSELAGVGDKADLSEEPPSTGGISELPDIRNTELGSQEDIQRAERKGGRIDRI